MDEKSLRRKWSFRINGQKQVLIKRAEEKSTHVLMKIFLAKLYHPFYQDIKIEVRYSKEKRYKPDLLALSPTGEALFWGECGEVGEDKIISLIQKYRDTHLCFSKWAIKPNNFEGIIDKALAQLKKKRSAPIDFINFQEEHKAYIEDNGEVGIEKAELYRKRWH